MMQQDGIARVPGVSLVAELTFPGLMNTPARVDRVEKFAGASVGSAVVQFKLPFAQKALIGYGKAAAISVGGQYIFHGTIGTAPISVSADSDFVEAVLYDDKWGMSANIVGQRGIGSLAGDDKGFPDVGFEVIFNRDGKPNKKTGELNFSTGAGAALWTLKEALEFIFQYYISNTVATLNVATLDDAFNRTPSHLCLVGQDGLAAVDAIVQCAGRSWGLKAKASKSEFVLVKPGGGTNRTVFFFDPRGGRVVTDAGEWHANSASIQGSILHARDVHQARSARIVIETALSSIGTNPVLKKATFTDKKFAARFISDVTKYSANGLGADLTDGSPAKPWLSNLVTRINSAGGYVAKADAATHQNDARCEIPVWVSTDGTAAKYRLATGGYEFDYAKGLIDFEPEVTFIGADKKADKVKIADWTKAAVMLTVAVVTETPQFVESESGASYLPKKFYVLIDKPDLVPERRLNSILPKISTTPPDDQETFAAALEKYIDVEDRLQDAVDASLASMPKVETPISVEFPLFPLCEIGDALKLAGRDLGASGDEVIVSIRYAVHEQYRTSIDATNVTAAINPERFIKR